MNLFGNTRMDEATKKQLIQIRQAEQANKIDAARQAAKAAKGEATYFEHVKPKTGKK